MRLYLAGPITGHADYRDRFATAATQLAAAGHTPINPAELGERPGWAWEDYMRAALLLLLQCQGVALLPGWTGSRGARVEEGLANQLAMPAHPVGWWANRHGDLACRIAVAAMTIADQMSMFEPTWDELPLDPPGYLRSGGMPMLTVVPVTLRQANEFVAEHHRHHKPVQGHRFSVGVVDSEGVMRGVCVVGRPVGRGCDPYLTAEVTRLATDGTPNACSILYGAVARAARAMGFARIQTYILADETGASLRASGWERVAEVYGREWKHTAGPRRTDQPNTAKSRWERRFK